MLLFRRVIPSSTLASALLTTSSSRAHALFTSTMTTRHLARRHQHAPVTTQRAFFSALFGGGGGAGNFATIKDIQSALENENTTILDVRGPDEIAATGYWKTAANNAWVHMPCSPFDASVLEQTAPGLLRDKSSPIIVHCASGKRSAKAKEVLDGLGYEQVLNVGGWNQVQQVIADSTK